MNVRVTEIGRGVWNEVDILYCLLAFVSLLLNGRVSRCGRLNTHFIGKAPPPCLHDDAATALAVLVVTSLHLLLLLLVNDSHYCLLVRCRCRPQTVLSKCSKGLLLLLLCKAILSRNGGRVQRRRLPQLLSTGMVRPLRLRLRRC